MARPYDFSRSVINHARVRQNGKCALCGELLDDLEEHAHHVIPNQSGNPQNSGHDWLRSIDNCVVLCDVCHGIVHDDSNYRTGAVAPPDYYPYSHGQENSSTHRTWLKLLNEKAKQLFDTKLNALNQMRTKQAGLKNLIDLDYNDHKAQLNLYNQSFLGFWTNRLWNGEPPQLIIWTNAYSWILRSGREMSAGNLIEGIRCYFMARYFYLGALKVYRTWKDGIEGAGRKMETMIGATAAGIVLAILAPAGVTAVIEMASGEVVATAQTTARILTLCERADTAIRIVDAVEETETLLEIQRMQEIEELMRVVETMSF